MSEIHHDTQLARVKDGDVITLKARRVVNGQSVEVTETGVVEGLTISKVDTVEVFQFTLVEADRTRTNRAGVSSWPVTMHTPFWPDFNEQHGGMMRFQLDTDLDMYRVWDRIMQLDNRTKQEMVDRYVECLVTGETVVPQDREAYYQLINA